MFSPSGSDTYENFCRKSGKREAQGLVGQSVTHAATNPTQSPCWEELLLVEIKEEEEKNEG